MEKDTVEILEIVNFIKDQMDQMATKDDIREVRSEIATVRSEMNSLRGEMNAGFASVYEETHAIRAELKSIHQRLDELEAIIQNTTQFSKEIDYVIEQQAALIERVQVIETHLNIKPKVAV